MLLQSLLSATSFARPDDLPPTMRAYIQRSATNQSFEPAFAVPAVGDLHRRYSGLTTSCEVLLQVAASSVNPSDIHPSVAASELPLVLGSDVSGVVRQTGEGCSRLKPGDRVFGDVGANAHTSGLLKTKTKELGGYAEWAVALESQLGVVPDAIGLAEAAALPKVALTSYKALVWYTGALNTSGSPWADVPGGPVVLILGGSGGCGTTGLQLARNFGASSLITTTSKANFDYCRAAGATRLIDYQSEDWWTALDDGSVDVIYDTVGQSGTGARAMAKLRDGGRYVTITGALAPAGAVKPGTQQHMFINSDTNLDSAALLDAIAQLMAEDKLRMSRLTAFSLEQVPAAFAASETHLTVGKLVVNVTMP